MWVQVKETIMSTRGNIHFVDQFTGDGPPVNIYRHSDSYPDGTHGVPADMERFFQAVEDQCAGDTRFGCAEYLATKFVVWQASRYARDPEKPLAFLSLGVANQDHGDIEYLYTINCAKFDAKGRPTVTWEKV